MRAYSASRSAKLGLGQLDRCPQAGLDDLGRAWIDRVLAGVVDEVAETRF